MSETTSWAAPSFDGAIAQDYSNSVWEELGLNAPVLLRGDVAQILNCTPLTIRNRERAGKYPDPPRAASTKYRQYGLQDVLHLQWVTNKKLDYAPILSVLYDKGYTDLKAVEAGIRAEISYYKVCYIDPVFVPKNS